GKHADQSQDKQHSLHAEQASQCAQHADETEGPQTRFFAATLSFQTDEQAQGQAQCQTHQNFKIGPVAPGCHRNGLLEHVPSCPVDRWKLACIQTRCGPGTRSSITKRASVDTPLLACRTSSITRSVVVQCWG